ncbi:epididymal secretory protein E1 [Lingula anatina]|uniref:Epididymal secretory protein E1 n=1 Tax=Lingula anatina TaxID=7574 RepID=A0A1S3IPU1_LINAN|nr:epididymal secretory protein E1 [Lingula anatina]|eukprot:XP_013400078.1 epididymal secretory protein E1 [Lingula anatina]
MCRPFVFLVCCLATSSLAMNVKFKDCGSAVGKISTVDVEPCKKEPCTLVRGTNATVTVAFKANEAATKLTASVHGIVAGVPVPFQVPVSNGCAPSGVACPTKTGQDYNYSTYVPVLKIYPKISVVVKWELKDQNGKDMFCFVIPAVIS